MATTKSTARGRKARKPIWEDRFAEEFTAQPAQLTAEQRDSIDARFSSKEAWRRLALVTLTKSGAELIDMVTEKRDNAIQLARTANITAEYATMLRGFASLMDTASVRLNVALCSRPDMQTIFDEVAAVDSGREVSHG